VAVDRRGRFNVIGDGGGHELTELDLALVWAAILISEKYHVETALARPAETLDIARICTIIAELGSAPLRVNVARDLATAGFSDEDLRPLLRSTLPDEIQETDRNLADHRNELVKLGSTVSWPDFPPRAPDPGTVDEPRGPA
jgi:hypothetical protein